MAKRKPKDIGELPPTMFNLDAVSTPVSSVSEASIDTRGYDPAWDDPDFGKPKSPAVKIEGDGRIEPNGDRNEHEDSAIPENPSLVTEEESPAPETVAIEIAEAVEVVEAAPTAISDELSYDEQQDRLHLERKVERAFYEAGKALRSLRDRRLYRSTHKTFEAYCLDRFGFKRRHPYQLIDAANVVDNLLASAPTNSSQMCAIGAQTEMGTNGAQTEMGTNGAQTEMGTNGAQGEMSPIGAQTEMSPIGAQGEMSPIGAQTEMSPIGAQIWPTSERQIRSLAKLDPDRQREVWQQAVEEAGGKVPSGRIVKEIAERMQSLESPPEKPTRAHHLPLEAGGLVEVMSPNNLKIHARLGRISAVREKTVEVWMRDRDTMTMNKHVLRHHQVEAVPLEREPGVKEVCDRISALRERSLDAIDLEILALLERAVVLTPRELEHLAGIEGRAGG